MFAVKKYDREYQGILIDFLQKCLPESGRKLELDGRHHIYHEIEDYFKNFWCLFFEDAIIGTVAIREISPKKCELKSLYVFQEHHGKGLGYRLLMHAVDEAKSCGYKEMYLDTLSTSEKALCLYKRAEFVLTDKYNDNQFADISMVLDISQK